MSPHLDFAFGHPAAMIYEPTTRFSAKIAPLAARTDAGPWSPGAPWLEMGGTGLRGDSGMITRFDAATAPSLAQ